jgi:thioredoxin 1
MESFKDVISSGQLVLVDFYATWCGPCKTMHLVLLELKQRLGEQIRILKIDVDKYQNTAAEYRIQSVPTLMLFRNGQMLWRQSGALPLNALLQQVQAHL